MPAWILLKEPPAPPSAEDSARSAIFPLCRGADPGKQPKESIIEQNPPRVTLITLRTPNLSDIWRKLPVGAIYSDTVCKVRSGLLHLIFTSKQNCLLGYLTQSLGWSWVGAVTIPVTISRLMGSLGNNSRCKSLKRMVRPARFKPATYGLEVRS